MEIIKHKNNWYWGKSIYIIIDGGVGIVSLSFDNEYPEICTISGISVADPYKNLGYGDTLLDLAEKEAKENGYDKVVISCEKNSFVQQWYQRKGYTLTDTCCDIELYTLVKEI